MATDERCGTCKHCPTEAEIERGDEECLSEGTWVFCKLLDEQIFRLRERGDSPVIVDCRCYPSHWEPRPGDTHAA